MLYRWAASQYSLTHKGEEEGLEQFQEGRTQKEMPKGRYELKPNFREDWYTKKQPR